MRALVPLTHRLHAPVRQRTPQPLGWPEPEILEPDGLTINCTIQIATTMSSCAA